MKKRPTSKENQSARDKAIMPEQTMDYEPTNPRWLLWRVCCCPDASTGAHEYMAWNTERWAEFAKERGRKRPFSKQDHADYDAWLVSWAHKFLTSNRK